MKQEDFMNTAQKKSSTTLRKILVSALSSIWLYGCTLQKVPSAQSELSSDTLRLVEDLGVKIDPRIDYDSSVTLKVAQDLLPRFIRESGKIIIRGPYYENDVASGLSIILTLGLYGGVSDGFMKVSVLGQLNSCDDYVQRYNRQQGGWLAAPLALLSGWRFAEDDGLLEREALVTLLNEIAHGSAKYKIGACSERFITYVEP